MKEPKPRKQRLDALLVELELCDSRQRAQRVIRAGEVTVNGDRIDKPGTQVPVNADIKLAVKPRFVSRGGEKLAKALEAFPIETGDRICLDGGISTGGFTDCLLKAGAAKVYGIDVGYGQVAWTLRQDERVTLLERTNLRHLQPEELYIDPSQPRPNLGVVDVSFIGLAKVMPALWRLLEPPRELVLLVKPQFEVGRDRIGKKGVVRDVKDRAGAIIEVYQAAQKLGWHYWGLTGSPISGPAGNVEYLLWLRQDSPENIETLTEKLPNVFKNIAANPSESHFLKTA
ncbi:MAG: TlyA family RNA methyltransferase [Cyanobacteria bacterium P01_D01_bin.73]